jgi:hypothetical protein
MTLLYQCKTKEASGQAFSMQTFLISSTMQQILLLILPKK